MGFGSPVEPDECIIHDVLLVSWSASSDEGTESTGVEYWVMSSTSKTVNSGWFFCNDFVVFETEASATICSHNVASSNDSYAEIESLVDKNRTAKPSLDRASVVMI